MVQSNEKRAVLLLSGGIDSYTVLEMAKSQGYQIFALTFSYGQRHHIELEAVKRILSKSPVQEHKVIEIDLRAFGGSALTDSIAVPKDHVKRQVVTAGVTERTAVPVTYVPARNTIFLSFALGYAEVIGSYDLFIGANAVDSAGYPDCRPEYLSSFEQMANLATAVGTQGGRQFKLHAPLIQMGKTEIIKTGLSLGVDYGLTISCYDPTLQGLSCGKCSACQLRLQGFEGANAQDPAPYV